MITVCRYRRFASISGVTLLPPQAFRHPLKGEAPHSNMRVVGLERAKMARLRRFQKSLGGQGDLKKPRTIHRLWRAARADSVDYIFCVFLWVCAFFFVIVVWLSAVTGGWWLASNDRGKMGEERRERKNEWRDERIGETRERRELRAERKRREERG